MIGRGFVDDLKKKNPKMLPLLKLVPMLLVKSAAAEKSAAVASRRSMGMCISRISADLAAACKKLLPRRACNEFS